MIGMLDISSAIDSGFNFGGRIFMGIGSFVLGAGHAVGEIPLAISSGLRP